MSSLARRSYLRLWASKGTLYPWFWQEGFELGLRARLARECGPERLPWSALVEADALEATEEPKVQQRIASLFPVSSPDEEHGYECVHCRREQSEGFACIECERVVCVECVRSKRHLHALDASGASMQRVGEAIGVSRGRVDGIEWKAKHHFAASVARMQRRACGETSLARRGLGW